MKKFADLPFASTLCGSCSNVCPVKIDIHDQLYKWRQVLVKDGYVDKQKERGMKAMKMVLSSPTLFKISGKAGRSLMKLAPFALNNRFNPWYQQRKMPAVPEMSFAERYKKNRKKNEE